jgi:hypothetical protein
MGISLLTPRYPARCPVPRGEHRDFPTSQHPSSLIHDCRSKSLADSRAALAEVLCALQQIALLGQTRHREVGRAVTAHMGAWAAAESPDRSGRGNRGRVGSTPRKYKYTESCSAMHLECTPCRAPLRLLGCIKRLATLWMSGQVARLSQSHMWSCR